MQKIYKDHQELLKELKKYFSQDKWDYSKGHVPIQFVKFIGCKACIKEQMDKDI